ncbi:unnamed protein product [Peniophora sp. CBMAI 1063]|nr:unnamed protein product [Peniophora sp. CBMAI 1063]
MSHFAIICQQRNAELPISRLPPEILCSVFHILQELEPIFPSDLSFYPTILTGGLSGCLAWMKILHVMHSWRTTALGDATLWTAVSSSLSREAFEETMRRRRDSDAPLHVDLSTSLEGARWGNVTPRDYIVHRTGLESITSLQVIGRSLPLLQPRVQMAKLQSLSVHLTSDGPATLPRELPLIEAPALRRLYIHNVIPCEHSGTSTRPLDVAPLNNLTHLTLSMHPDKLD